jgi:tripartite-type tricarboxylate transporter receptor subunit TctC
MLCPARPLPCSRRTLLGSTMTLAGLLALGVTGIAKEQAPVEQLRILCTGPAGSIPDIVARRIAEQLTSRFARGVVVDNRPGAAGQIAVNALKLSPPDGSTILLAQGAIATVYPYLYPKLAYDPSIDLQAVSLAAEMTLGLAVGPLVPDSVTSIRELIEWMRKNPKTANIGSPGSGTLPHLLEVMLFKEADVAWQHVVYAGGPPAMVDLLGGRIAGLVLPEGLLRQQRTSGRLRVLATSSAQRSSYLPDVATLAEQGYPDLVVREWFGFFLSGQVNTAAVGGVSQALQTAIARSELVRAFADSGMVAASSTPLAMAARVASEQRYWEPVIRAAGIRGE